MTPQEREIARGPTTESGRVEIINKKPRQELSPVKIRAFNETRDPYHWRSTGTATNPGMNYLSDLIIRPGIEKTFGPLLLYRGGMTRGRAHRRWNFVLLMMAAEAETLGDGIKLAHNPAFAQLCGPTSVPARLDLWRFFWRLHDNPAVTRNIEGLTDYVKSMGAETAWPSQRVDRFSDRIDCAEWRISIHENAGQDYRDRERGIPQSQQLFYPFMAHDPEKPDGARNLVLLVNQAVPNYWPEHVRADVCQEMIVGLLDGSIQVDDLHDSVRRYITKHFKVQPQQYGEGGLRLSLDAPVPGTIDLSWTERV